MSCDDLITRFLMDYVDGELSSAVLADFEAHLRVCPSCRAYLDSYRKTIGLAQASGSEPEAPGSTAVPEGLVRAILATAVPGIKG